MIIIGKESGADTNICGNLRVKEKIDPAGGAGSNLELATSMIGYDVVIGAGMVNRTTTVNNKLKSVWGVNHPLSSQPVPIGGDSNGVHLASTGHNTRVMGTLQVDEVATLEDTVTCQDDVTIEGTLHVTGDSVDLDAPVDLDCTTTGVALDVTNASDDPGAVAIKATGQLAIDARGRSRFSDHIALPSDKRMILDGTGAQNYITYNSAEERIEFYIGGVLKFIIDENGGSNP